MRCQLYGVVREEQGAGEFTVSVGWFRDAGSFHLKIVNHSDE